MTQPSLPPSSAPAASQSRKHAGGGRLAVALPVALFGLAAALSVVAAQLSVDLIEDASEHAVRGELRLAGLDWARVEAEGLQVFLIGTAPNEADRFAALSRAGGVVDAARVIDQMDVEQRIPLAAPQFSMEILRNAAGISIIGLVPQNLDREALLDDLRALAGPDAVDDLLETSMFPAPEGWDRALRFAMRALKLLPGAKISLTPDRVLLTARADSLEEKARAETELARSRPEGIEVTLEIAAPRPVITPFTLRFSKTAQGAQFDACSADTPAARERIVQAAKAAGIGGDPSCTIGLGVPTTRWAEAAEQAIAAVDALGGGTVTLSDTTIALLAPEGTAPETFDDVLGQLDNSLPPVFELTAELPEPPDASPEEPPEFIATLSPEGNVLLRGRVASDRARNAAGSYAKAAFSSKVVRMNARVAEDLPRDWSLRVLTGIEALSQLASGAVTVTPDELQVRGKTGRETARDDIARLLVAKLGENARFTNDVTYDERLDPDKAPPPPEQCKAMIDAVVGDRKIRFEPGSDALDAQGRGIMDDIADVLLGCGALPLEIQGHTDSQGREVMNQELSQSRAETILRELGQRRVRTATFRAVGYGESTPIADNGTEEGREANRRIEFVLVQPEAPLAPGEETQANTETSE